MSLRKWATFLSAARERWDRSVKVPVQGEHVGGEKLLSVPQCTMYVPLGIPFYSPTPRAKIRTQNHRPTADTAPVCWGPINSSAVASKSSLLGGNSAFYHDSSRTERRQMHIGLWLGVRCGRWSQLRSTPTMATVFSGIFLVADHVFAVWPHCIVATLHLVLQPLDFFRRCSLS